MHGDIHERLETALIELLAGTRAELTGSHERGWASATFIGARHRFRFQVRAPDAEVDAVAQSLGNHEFDLTGDLVADICVRELTRREDSATTFEIEVLTVEVS